MAQSGGHAEVVERRFADLKSQLRPSELGQRYALPVVWGIVCLVFSILRPNTFPTTNRPTFQQVLELDRLGP